MIGIRDIKVALRKIGKSHVFDTLSRNQLMMLDESWLAIIKHHGRLKCKTSTVDILTQGQIERLKEKFDRVEIYQKGQCIAIYEKGEYDPITINWSDNARIIAFDYATDMVVLYRYYLTSQT